MTGQQLQDWAFPATHNATSDIKFVRVYLNNPKVRDLMKIENIKYQSSIEVEENVSQKEAHLDI